MIWMWSGTRSSYAFAAGGEWQVSEMLPVSLFVEAQFGENDYATVFGGVKFYFGSDNKSLKRRHARTTRVTRFRT